MPEKPKLQRSRWSKVLDVALTIALILLVAVLFEIILIAAAFYGLWSPV